MRKGDSASSKAAHESVSMRKPSACRATPPAGAPSRVKHHVPPSCSHGTARAGMRASTSSTVAQDGDERWEGVSKSSMTQKHMQECLGFFVRVWLVIMFRSSWDGRRCPKWCCQNRLSVTSPCMM